MILRFLALAVAVTHADLFTSIADMQSMIESDTYLPNVLDQFVREQENRLDRLKGLALEYKKKPTPTDPKDTDVTNPISAFLIIKDRLREWKSIQARMRENNAQELVERITNGDYGVMYPSEDDFKGAAIALLRLQDTYRLDPHELAEGRIYHDQLNRTLDSGDCFQIGKAAYNDEDYYHTVQWMLESEAQLEKEGEQGIASREDIMEYLSFALYKQGNLKHALKYIEDLYKLNPNHPRAKGNIKWYEDLLGEEGVKKSDMRKNLGKIENRRPSSVLGNKERTMYEALCRNEVPKSPKDTAKLYCYYKRDRPFLIYAPIKVEIMRYSPLAVLFKDVISDEEVGVIQELAKPRLARATVHDSTTGKLVHASYRISKSAWLKGWEHEVVDRVNRRIELMTNLDMDTAEELQIANYGIGGHYDPHFDHSRTEETKSFESLGTGNRIATVLFYMTEPKFGGGTVFTDAKSTITPTKNDALFWYNLFKQGDGNPQTRHAACPVLVGVKWVSNKWIHTKNQEFRRPCGLKPSDEERFVGDLGVGAEPRVAPNLSPVLSKNIWETV